MSIHMRGPLGAFIFLALLFAPAAANAEEPLRDLILDYKNANVTHREFLELLIASNENGIAWANAELRTVRHETRMFCPPEKVSLTGNQIMDILEREMNAKPFVGQYPYGLALLLTLEDTFPCGGNR